MIDAPCGFNARKGPHAIEQLIVENDATSRIRFFRTGDGNDHGEDVVRIEAWINRLQSEETANHQPRSDQ